MAIFVSSIVGCVTNPDALLLTEPIGGAPTVSGYAGFAGAKLIDSPSMAEPVTRHALIPQLDNFQYLLCGFDSLDLGLFVEWGTDWPVVLKALHGFKEKAQKSGEVVEETTPDRKCVFFP
jgi:hypothetical protein